MSHGAKYIIDKWLPSKYVPFIIVGDLPRWQDRSCAIRHQAKQQANRKEKRSSLVNFCSIKINKLKVKISSGEALVKLVSMISKMTHLWVSVMSYFPHPPTAPYLEFLLSHSDLPYCGNNTGQRFLNFSVPAGSMTLVIVVQLFLTLHFF